MDDIVFLFDVDNTLLDNDAIQHDLRVHITDAFGEAACRRYWELFEELRQELGYGSRTFSALARRRLARDSRPCF